MQRLPAQVSAFGISPCRNLISSSDRRKSLPITERESGSCRAESERARSTECANRADEQAWSLAVGGGAWCVARTWGGARTLRWPRHDLLSPLRGRPKYAVVSNEVSPRRRHQRGETAEQLARLEDEDLAAVAEAPFHAVREFGIGKRREPLLRERRTGGHSRTSAPGPAGRLHADGHRRAARSPGGTRRGAGFRFCLAACHAGPTPTLPETRRARPAAVHLL